MFAGLNQEICARAWAVIEPAVLKAAEMAVTDGARGTLIVLHPAIKDGTIMFTAHVGDPNSEYLANAKGKVAVTLRTGMDSSRVRQDFPYLYRAGDIKYPGAIIREGLIVAFSGVQGEFDEMICEWMVAALRGICRNGFAEADKAPGAYL